MIKKKFGFTLAEILITLSIIGVVAALTAPALTRNSGNASTGPKLAKVKASFELANQNMMADEGCTNVSTFIYDLANNNLLNTGATIYTEEYIRRLSKYWRISKVKPRNEKIMDYNGNKLDAVRIEPIKPNGQLDNLTQQICYFNGVDRFGWKTPEGCVVEIVVNSHIMIDNGENTFRPDLFIYSGEMFVDINGNRPPNRIGKDIFLFLIQNKGGTLVPYGWYEISDLQQAGLLSDSYWKTSCNKDGVKGNGFSCTASIFANNYKVIYEE